MSDQNKKTQVEVKTDLAEELRQAPGISQVPPEEIEDKQVTQEIGFTRRAFHRILGALGTALLANEVSGGSLAQWLSSVFAAEKKESKEAEQLSNQLISEAEKIDEQLEKETGLTE